MYIGNSQKCKHVVEHFVTIVDILGEGTDHLEDHKQCLIIGLRVKVVVYSFVITVKKKNNRMLPFKTLNGMITQRPGWPDKDADNAGRLFKCIWGKGYFCICNRNCSI